MPNFTYIRDIPDGPHNPSVDQPDMKINTNSIDDLITQDHYGFNAAGLNFSGYHKQVHMPILAAIPAVTFANQGTLYTKTAISTGVATESDLFYTPDASTIEYQLTRTITAQSAKFGTNTNYQVGPPNLFGGWTFLPGGLVMQYGSFGLFSNEAANFGNGGTITFPFPFNNIPFSIQVTLLCKAGGTATTRTISVEYFPSPSNFLWNLDSNSSGSYVGLMWTAIGV